MGLILILHGAFVDEFLIELVLPLSIFGALYWWSSRKAKKKRAAASDTAKGRGGPKDPGA